jgi:hypothetical protein
MDGIVMSGVIIFSADETPYKTDVDCVVMSGMVLMPDDPSTTYICFWNDVTQKKIEPWLDVVQHRLVVIVDKLPKLTKEFKELVIIDKTLTTVSEYASYDKALQAMFRYQDRQYVFDLINGCKLPIPLALTWLETNRPQNVSLWRFLADVAFTLPDRYAWSIMAFCVQPDGKNPKWPKRSKGKDSDETPNFVRPTDEYWHTLASLEVDIRNEVRDTEPEPTKHIKGVRKEPTTQWL